MTRIPKLVVSLAIAAFAIPALAQSPKDPSRKPSTDATAPTIAIKPLAVNGAAPDLASGGFAYRGEGIGWEITSHKYVFRDGGFVMSDECDHAVRIVKAPTREEIESVRRISPGP